MKGYRTLLVNAALAALTAVAPLLINFDWVSAVGPNWAIVIVAGINVGLRLITTGPVGTKIS